MPASLKEPRIGRADRDEEHREDHELGRDHDPRVSLGEGDEAPDGVHDVHGTRVDSGYGEDAPVQLVRRSRDPAPRAGADLPLCLAVRGPHRRSAGAGHVLRDAAQAARRSSSRARATASCAPSSTSAATAASRSSREPASARRCNAPTTRGRTASTARCAQRRARRSSPTSTEGELGLCPRRRRHLGAVRVREHGSRSRAARDALGSMPAQVAELGLDVDGLVFYTRWQTEVDANWKVVCENFLECYHCAVAHPQLAELLDVSADAYALSTDGRLSSQHGPTREIADHEDASRRRAPAQPVPLPLAEPRREHLPRAAEHLDRADRAGLTRTDAPVSRLLLRRATSTRPGSTS